MRELRAVPYAQGPSPQAGLRFSVTTRAQLSFKRPVGIAYLHQATGSRTSEAESRDPGFRPEKEGEAARQKGNRDYDCLLQLKSSSLLPSETHPRPE